MKCSGKIRVGRTHGFPLMAHGCILLTLSLELSSRNVGVRVQIDQTLARIKRSSSQLKRQLMLAALVSGLLKLEGKGEPVVIGGCALAYYSREVYFTSDVDLSYADRPSLNRVLSRLGFARKGRYWVHEGLKLAVEAPASDVPDNDPHLETVVLGRGLECKILGIEDLIIDRLNACKHWNSRSDCEMAELLVRKYNDELDWPYLLRKAILPENDCQREIKQLKRKAAR